MIQDENLDVRAVTMGISLSDCASRDVGRVCERVHDKILARRRPARAGGARDPGEVRRADRQPPSVGHADRRRGRRGRRATPSSRSPTPSTRPPPRSASTSSAASRPSSRRASRRHDAALIDAIPQAIAETRRVCSSVNVASTRAGINMDAVTQHGRGPARRVARAPPTATRIGCAKIVTFCNVPEDNPFMAGALHGSGEPEVSINVGISGPGVIRNVVAAPPRPVVHRPRRPDQAHDVQDHPRRRAGRPRGGRDARRRRWASSTSRWRPRRRSATRWPRSSRPWDWSAPARRAPPRRSPCSTTPSRRAAPWRPRRPAASRAPSSR